MCCATPQGEYRMDEGLVQSCGKMRMLDQLLPRLKAEGRKVHASALDVCSSILATTTGLPELMELSHRFSCFRK
jgi:hypothetical protein